MEREINLVILDTEFRRIAVVDYYSSLTWHKTMYGDGECEIEIPIDEHDLSFIQRNHYIVRNDDEMVCQILYTETRESAEGADILYVKAADITLLFLNKRIIFTNFMHTGSVQTLITKLINDNFSANASIAARRILASDGTSLIRLQFVGPIGEEGLQYTSSNNSIGDLIKQVLETYRYAMMMTYEETNGVVHFVLTIFRPSNRSSYVIFDQKMDNIVNTNFSSEFVRGSNIILVGGEKDENTGTRYFQSVGSMASGLDRNEEFLDADNLSHTVEWQEVLKEYPPKKAVYDFPVDAKYGATTVHFTITEDGKTMDRWYYRMGRFKIPIQDMAQFTALKESFPASKGYLWYIDVDPNTGITNFYIENCDIAVFKVDIINDPPKKDEDGNYDSNPTAQAQPVLYNAMMIQKGYEKYQEGTLDCSFSAEIDPNSTFLYKRDYIIGDYVGIYNKYGIKSAVQVTDVSETIDPSGYHLDVSLSDAKSKNAEDVIIYCGSDSVDTVYLCTDDGDFIIM